MTLNDLFNWLVTGGGATVVVIFILTKTNMDWFNKLNTTSQTYVEFGLAVVISVLAKLGMTYIPASVITALEPYFEIVRDAFLAFFGVQLANLAPLAKKAIQAFLNRPIPNG